MVEYKLTFSLKIDELTMTRNIGKSHTLLPLVSNLVPDNKCITLRIFMGGVYKYLKTPFESEIEKSACKK